MLSRRLVTLSLLVLAAGCSPALVNEPQLPTAHVSEFPAAFADTGATVTASAAPAYDPFSDTSAADIAAKTPFKPVFDTSLGSLKANDSPAVTSSVYQTSTELQVGEVDTLLEHASFHFEKLTKGLQIGGGQIDIGTPPKLSLPVVIAVEDTDGKSYAVLSAKSNSLTANIYVADIEVKVLYGSLALISLGNAARAAALQGNAVIGHSAKVTQIINAGYVQLPADAGTVRTRVVIKSVPDPSNQVSAQKVINSSLTVTP